MAVLGFAMGAIAVVLLSSVIFVPIPLGLYLTLAFLAAGLGLVFSLPGLGRAKKLGGSGRGWWLSVAIPP